MVCANSGRTPWPWDPCRSRSHAARSSSCSALRGAVRPRCCACWAGSRPRTPVGSKWRGGGGDREGGGLGKGGDFGGGRVIKKKKQDIQYSIRQWFEGT